MWEQQVLQPRDVLVPPGLPGATCYVVERFIGRGGMGEVYEVSPVGENGRYAAKCSSARLAADPKLLARMRREGVALERIRHENVVKVFHTYVRDDGMIWMVMELLVGRTVGELLGRYRKLNPGFALKVARDACAGLAALHANGLIHRDIKPDNLHIGADLILRILDLGTAKFFRYSITRTTAGVTLGTLAYMSPEQLNNDPIDPRSDLFSLGIVLYMMLAGRHPFAEADGMFTDRRSLGMKIIQGRHTPFAVAAPNLPAYVGEVVERCLALKPSDRFESAQFAFDFIVATMDRLERDLGPKAFEPLPEDDFATPLGADSSGRVTAEVRVEPARATAPSLAEQAAPPEVASPKSRPLLIEIPMSARPVNGLSIQLTPSHLPPLPIEIAEQARIQQAERLRSRFHTVRDIPPEFRQHMRDMIAAAKSGAKLPEPTPEAREAMVRVNRPELSATPSPAPVRAAGVPRPGTGPSGTLEMPRVPLDVLKAQQAAKQGIAPARAEPLIGAESRPKWRTQELPQARPQSLPSHQELAVAARPPPQKRRTPPILVVAVAAVAVVAAGLAAVRMFPALVAPKSPAATDATSTRPP